jgi:hypothetical protein
MSHRTSTCFEQSQLVQYTGVVPIGQPAQWQQLLW